VTALTVGTKDLATSSLVSIGTKSKDHHQTVDGAHFDSASQFDSAYLDVAAHA